MAWRFSNLTTTSASRQIALTLVSGLLLVPVFGRDRVPAPHADAPPELKAIRSSTRATAPDAEEQMKLYKERGVNPASGCLPALLQMLLLVPMYQVFSQGLNAPNISSMLSVAGNQVLTVTCRPEQPARAVHQPTCRGCSIPASPRAGVAFTRAPVGQRRSS
jgi:hypothetical protein